MTAIVVSPEAVERLRDELDGRILRISFTTGCGGSGYRLASVDEPFEGDDVLVSEGIRIALDEMATAHLEGARIEPDEEEGFILDHPAAAVSTWCG